MAESYNAIAIKMGIDTSQFDAGLRRTQKQIDDVAARMAKASEENRQRARMAGGMAGMGVGVTPEDRRLSEQIATRLKINQIINQQNQLFEQNRARQQAINAETERYNRVTSTLLVNMIRRTEQESIDNRQLAKRINANLTLNKIYDQQAAALSLRAQKEAALENSARTKRLINANKVLTQIYQQQEAALALRAQKEEALAQQAKTSRIIQSNRIITEIYRQQNQLLELKRDIQKSIDAEAEKERKILEYLNKNWEHHLQVQQRLRVVRSTEIADQIRANELAAIADRRLAERINANLTLNKIYNQQAEALARRTSKQEVAQAERLFQVETSRVLQSQELIANEERIRTLREDILARAAADASRLGEEQKVAQAERLFQVETSRAIKSEEQLANEERIRTLREDILARATADANRQAEEQERLAAVTEARVQIRRMLSDEEEKTNALLAFQNKQRRELLALQKQLDAAGIQGSRRKRLIQEYQTLQAATKAEWEKGNAQKYVTDLERKAEAVKDRLITAEQRHAATLVDLKNMLQQNLLTQQQYSAAVKQADQALAMQKGGFGRMAGAATQASFAIEDFVQVMSMGGGLNMALMSASNNVTMVIRSLNLFKGTLGTVAMFGLPLLAVGVTSAIGYFAKAAKATDRWKDALEELERTWKNSGWREMARLELKDFGREIEGSSFEQLIKRENDLLAEQEKLKAKLFQQDMERTRKNQELFIGLVGGQEAYMKMQQSLTKVATHGSEVEKQQARELLSLMGQAQQAAIEGRREVALSSLREMLRTMEHLRETGKLTDAIGVSSLQAAESFGLITSLAGAFSADEWNKFLAGFNDPAFVDSLQELFGAQGSQALYGFEDNVEQLNAFRDELLGSETNLTEEQKRQLQVAEELLKVAQEKQRAVERETEAARQLAEEQKMVLDAKRQEMMFNMTATEEEKAAAEFERRRQEFVFGDMDITGPTFDQIKADQAFLLAAQKQTQQQIEKLQTFTSPEYLGALQQDAFKAQAEAFKQIDKARQEKPNPQLERQINLLNRIHDALSKGTPLVIAGGP